MTRLALQDGSLYEYNFDKQSCSWQHWMTGSASVSIPESMSFTDIIVPTIDTVRYSQLLQLLVAHNKHLLFVGPTGRPNSAVAAAGTDRPQCVGLPTASQPAGVSIYRASCT